MYQGHFSNKVAGLKPVTLLKKRLRHRCFPVKFAKFLRTLFRKTPPLPAPGLPLLLIVLCWFSLIQKQRLQMFFKIFFRVSNTGVSWWILRNFSEQLILWNTSGGCFWKFFESKARVLKSYKLYPKKLLYIVWAKPT